MFHSSYDDEDPWSEEVQTPFKETTHIRDANRERQTKIRHSRIDHIDFEKVIDGKYKDTYLDEDSEKSSKIVNCYCFFRSYLKEKGIDTVLVIWNYLTRRIEDRDESGKYLVIIELNAKENEQAIFDTVNTAGVRLTCADTIKNSLFQHYIDALRKENCNHERAQTKATELYDQQWDSIFSVSQEAIDYWNKSRQVGRLYRDNIEILLHCIAIIKEFFDPSKDKMSDLSECYKEYTEKLSSADLEAFIKEINVYAKLYQNSFEELDERTLYSYSSEQYLPRVLHMMDALEISTFLPYILHLLLLKERYDLHDVKEKFIDLERYLILHAICGETTRNYNKECLQLIKGTAIATLLAGCENITLDRFEYGLRHMNSNKLAAFLLFWVELYKRKTERPDFKELHDIYTLEHIMPQKWEQYWSVQDYPVYDEQNDLVGDEDRAKRIRSAAVYEIGNMTLLNSKLNTSLRNYDFKRKINGEGKKRGMKNLADCIITREIIENTVWNEKAIRERTIVISKVIIALWGLSFH